MQLAFTADEFREVLELLLEHERRANLDRRTADHIVPIAQRFLNHDFALGIDELEDLEEFLRDAEFLLRRDVGRALPGAERNELMRRHRLVEEALDRVAEACAMG